MVNIHISMEQTQSADEDYLIWPKALKQEQSRLISLYQIRSLQKPFFNYLTQWRKMLFSANYKGKHTLPCTFLHLLFGWSKVYSVSPTNALGRAAWRHISDFVQYFSSAKMGNLKKATSIKFIAVQTDQKPSDSCHMGENKLWLIDRRFSINTLELKCFKK